jgi:hypothetical protein
MLEERDLCLAIVETERVDDKLPAFSTYLIAASDQETAERIAREHPLSGGVVKRVVKLAQTMVQIWDQSGGPLSSTPAAPACQDEVDETLHPADSN